MFFYISGIAVDSANGNDINIIKKSGKVEALEQKILNGNYLLRITICLVQ